MNAEQIRAAFIRMHLARALGMGDRGLMRRTANEFTRYLKSCANSLSPLDRARIGRLLARVERAVSE